MTADPGLLEEAIRAGDAPRVVELLRGATEAERKACATALADLLKGPGFPMPQPVMLGSVEDAIGFVFQRVLMARDGVREQPSPGEREYRRWHELSQTPAFLAAAVGLAGGRGPAARILDEVNSWELPGEAYDAIAGVLADRNPGWLSELVRDRLTTRFSTGVDAWILARRLVRLGVIDRPGVPEYTLQMPQALTVAGGYGPRSVLEGLLADPGLLDDEVWRLFEVPGAGQWLAWGDDQWVRALAAVAGRGLLDRGRLLDACLDAFVRDFPPNTVGWYLRFHDQLGPAPAETAARTGKYLALLAAGNKPGVTLGQRVCGELLDAGALDPAAFLTASAPALVFPQKSVATAQLKLIGKIAATRPGVRDQALVTAAEAFRHVREDVQQAALKLIAKHGVPAAPAARSAITTLAAALSPALAPDVAALGLMPAPVVLAPAAATAGPAVPLPSDTPQPCVPVTDPAELVQLLARLMEDASDTLAVERALAGAVRLAALPLADRAWLAAPLLKRAVKQTNDDFGGPFSGHMIRTDMAWLVRTWGTGEPPPVHDERHEHMWGAEGRSEVERSGAARTMAGILSARVWEASRLIASGHAGSLLAAPEFADGTIGHGTLLDRLTVPGRSRHAQHDFEIALLRLAPGADEAFWAEWARLDEEMARAARRAYDERHARLDFEPRAGGPVEVDRSVGGMQPTPAQTGPLVTAGLAGAPADGGASRCWRLLTDLASPALNEHGRRGLTVRWGFPIQLDEVVAAWPLLCPHQPELVAAHLLRPLSDGLLPARSAATRAVESLAPAGRPFGRIGHLALVTGLASAGPDTRIAAAGVWARVSQEGRLDPALAASAITLGVTKSALKPNRLADALRYATLDPAAAATIASAAATAVASLLPARPPGLHLLLEEAARAAAASGAGAPGAQGAGPAGHALLPPEVAGLARSRDRTKLADAARRLARLTAR
jgi:hypothetical protein